jgi:hypothetical protein
MPRERKQFPLRIPQELYDVYEAWAADEFRSVNAQIEAVLVDAARRAGRLRPTDGTHDRLLAEELLLLAWDAARQVPAAPLSVQLPSAVGGALLLELALRDRLRIEVDVPRASSRATGDALLDEVARETAGRAAATQAQALGPQGRHRRTARPGPRPAGRTGAARPCRAEGARALPVARHRLTDPTEVERFTEEVRRVLAGGRPPTTGARRSWRWPVPPRSSTSSCRDPSGVPPGTAGQGARGDLAGRGGGPGGDPRHPGGGGRHLRRGRRGVVGPVTALRRTPRSVAKPERSG